MSFISIIICDNFLNVMADSRASEIYENGDVHRILDENFEKIKRIHEGTFVAITGMVEDAETFISKSNLYEEILESDRLKNIEELQIWFNSVIDYLVSIKSFTIHFGGVAKDSTLRSYIIYSKTKTLKEIVYRKGEIGYKFSGLKDVDNKFVLDTFTRLYRECDGSQESVLEVQAKLNDIIADINNSVNKNKKYFSIRR